MLNRKVVRAVNTRPQRGDMSPVCWTSADPQSCCFCSTSSCVYVRWEEKGVRLQQSEAHSGWERKALPVLHFKNTTENISGSNHKVVMKLLDKSSFLPRVDVFPVETGYRSNSNQEHHVSIWQACLVTNKYNLSFKIFLKHLNTKSETVLF